MNKGIVKTKFVPLSSILIQIQVASLISFEEVAYILGGNISDTRVLPLRVLVLIDEQGSNTFIELSMLHESLRDTVLHLEDILGIHVGSTDNLLEDNGQRERTHIGHHLACLGTEIRL